MKQIIVVLLAISLIISLCSCSMGIVPTPSESNSLTSTEKTGDDVGKTEIIVIGDSMVPTIRDGDKIVVSASEEYNTSDIIAFRRDSYGKEVILSRIIAVEGQAVDIDLKTGTVYIDGIALDEPYIDEPTTVLVDFVGPQVIPEGCVFCLGDNRNNAVDSRTAEIGMIPLGMIIGKIAD